MSSTSKTPASTVKPLTNTPNPNTYRPSFFERLLVLIFKFLNTIIPWHIFPRYLGAVNLAAYRITLREQNLHDTYPSPGYQGTATDTPVTDAQYLTARHSDGLFNSLTQPKMGCVGMRCGRNVERKWTANPDMETLMRPNPRIVSEVLLQRDVFKPATIVNLLAAAWIQFQVHDWFQHRNDERDESRYEIDLADGDTWEAERGNANGKRKMYVAPTMKDEVLDETDKVSAGYQNQNTHWWDGSQIYGSSETRTKQLRGTAVDGKLFIDTANNIASIPRDENGIPQTGFSSNWWVGLEILHTLFILEHNAICDALKAAYPDWSSEKLFDIARLVNCALMAKIHTVEWTPAILAHPTIEIALRGNWFGILGEKLNRLLDGKNIAGETLSGIPGSGVDHHNAPYALTEEFVSVYRLHSLIPDTLAFFDAATGEHKYSPSTIDVAFENARSPLDHHLSFTDVFYSFGINYPGAVTLNNYPNFLRSLHIPGQSNGEIGSASRHVDLATLDILRDRERGVPRYNAFRRLFHMAPATSYLHLVSGYSSPDAKGITQTHRDTANKLEKIYGSHSAAIEDVDLLVGCLCEPLPKGFGFSDTAFRVFILMASRRLKSDRFIAGKKEWSDEVYSKVGMHWIRDGDMKGVLGRHFPGLKTTLEGVKNPFAPWPKIGKAGEYTGPETNA